MSPRQPNKAGASTRLRRLLAMVPWLAANDGPTVEEVCRRFGLKKAELQADLDLLTYYVGVPPYTPDQFFEMVIEGGRVFARVTPSLDRPLRLTPSEGLALVVAGRALGADDPDGPLARGLAKIAALFGIDPDDAVDIDLGRADETTLALLRRAVADGRQVELDHYGEARDERQRRVVDPWRVANVGGSWYLSGFDHLRQAERSFRVDRILAATVREAAVTRPAPADVTVVAGPAADAPRVTLELTAAGRWVAESYPVDAVEVLDDGRLRVTLAVNGRPWLERLLLRLGPAGRVVDGPEELRVAGATAAARVLARYRP
jgi:proteasome accessory factor C